MFYALSWFVIFSLLALWSLGAWAVHAIAVWTVSNAGVLTGAPSGRRGPSSAGVAGALGAAGDRAGDDRAAFGLAPAVEGLLQAMPALAGGLTVATWVIWGLGSALLFLLGIGLHLVIAMWRRRGGGSGPQPARPFAA